MAENFPSTAPNNFDNIPNTRWIDRFSSRKARQAGRAAALAAALSIGGIFITGYDPGSESAPPPPAVPTNGDGYIECDKQAPKETVTLTAGESSKTITATIGKTQGIEAGQRVDAAYVNTEFSENPPGSFHVNTQINPAPEGKGNAFINSPTFQEPLVQPGTVTIETTHGQAPGGTEKLHFILTVTQEQNNLPANQTVVGVVCAAKSE